MGRISTRRSTRCICRVSCSVNPESILMVQVRVSPVMEAGQAVNVIWTHVDVTERHQEERLLELRNRALNYMSDGIFICDRQGSVLYTNQGFARLTGYEQRDAVGQPWTFLAVRCGHSCGQAC